MAKKRTMNRIIPAAVLFFAACGLSAADALPLEQLEGSYQAVSVNRDGKDEPADRVSTVKAKIAADELTITVKDKSFPAKIKIDAKAKPATIDIAPSDGPDKGHTFPGIYKVEDGRLVIAFTEKGDRPTEFKGGDGVLLLTLKREKK
jgi:uncharacterized protein (TIGR03067 family)